MFGKIFEQIYDSSIAEDWTVRTVFQDFIVLADVDGVVDKMPESISRRTNVPLDVVTRAIAILESPDPLSRSPDESGARIRRLDEHRPWGWEIVNYQKYRDIASDEQRRERTKIRTRKWRSNNKKDNGDAPVTHGGAPVTHGGVGDAMQKQKQKQKQKEMDLKTGTSTHPEHKAFIESWCLSFRAAHGFDYAFMGGKDGRAVKELLSISLPTDEILEIARKSWARNRGETRSFNCMQAVTINGFNRYFNQIRNEVTNGRENNKTGQRNTENPRNAGVCRAGIDYGEAARRKLLRQQDEERQRQMAGNLDQAALSNGALPP